MVLDGGNEGEGRVRIGVGREGLGRGGGGGGLRQGRERSEPLMRSRREGKNSCVGVNDTREQIAIFFILTKNEVDDMIDQHMI